MIYQWKPGSRVSLDAQVAGEHLEQLRQQHNGLNAALVVDDARPDDSPLHPAFEWDDAAAAEQYRLEQARYLVRSVVVVREDRADVRPVRAFVVIADEEDERAYTSMEVALANPAMRQQVLTRALNELHQWEQRYQELQELADVFSAHKRVRQKIAA